MKKKLYTPLATLVWSLAISTSYLSASQPNNSHKVKPNFDNKSLISQRKNLLITGFIRENIQNQTEKNIINTLVTTTTSFFYSMLVAYGGANIKNVIKIWDCTTNTCQYTIPGHTGKITSICSFNHPKSKYWFASSQQGEENIIKVWNKRGKCVMNLKGHTYWIKQIKPFGPNQIVSCGSNAELKVWSLLAKKCITTIETSTAGCLNAISVLPNKKILYGSSSGKLMIYSIDDLRIVKKFTNIGEPVMSLCNFGASNFVSGHVDGQLGIWNISRGVCVNTIKAHDSTINSVFSYGFNRIASASSDSSIKLWDARKKKPIKAFNEHVSGVKSIDFDDQLLVSGGLDRYVYVRDIHTNNVVFSQKHEEPIYSVCVI